MSNMDYYDSEAFKERLSVAHEFQDHCAKLISDKLGIVIYVYQSAKYQCAKGESMQGFEFKYDRNFTETNNLWIETAQRNTRNLDYCNSGIYQKDNAWIYCIGDYTVLYLFGKRNLCKLYKSGGFPVIESRAGTTKGFLLSKELADIHCAHKIETPNGSIVEARDSA